MRLGHGSRRLARVSRSIRVKLRHFIGGPDGKGKPGRPALKARLPATAWVSRAAQSITSLIAVNRWRPAAWALRKEVDLTVGAGAARRQYGAEARSRPAQPSASMSSAMKSKHLVEPLRERERRARKRIDEGRGDAVALGVPLVLRGDGAADAVEAGVECAVAVERAHQAAEQRGDGDAHRRAACNCRRRAVRRSGCTATAAAPTRCSSRPE